MKPNKKTLLFAIFLIIIFVGQAFLLSRVFAQAEPASEIPNPLKAESFEELVEDISQWFLVIAIPLGVLVILWAAVLFMTSGGDEEKVKKAKRALTWAIVGIAIILIGSGFITLIKDILQAK